MQRTFAIVGERLEGFESLISYTYIYPSRRAARVRTARSQKSQHSFQKRSGVSAAARGRFKSGALRRQIKNGGLKIRV